MNLHNRFATEGTMLTPAMPATLGLLATARNGDGRRPRPERQPKPKSLAVAEAKLHALAGVYREAQDRYLSLHLPANWGIGAPLPDRTLEEMKRDQRRAEALKMLADAARDELHVAMLTLAGPDQPDDVEPRTFALVSGGWLYTMEGWYAGPPEQHGDEYFGVTTWIETPIAKVINFPS